MVKSDHAGDREELPDEDNPDGVTAAGLDKGALIELARGLTVIQEVEVGDEIQTSVSSSRSQDMVTLLEHEEVTVTDLHIVTADERGDMMVTVISGDGAGYEPATSVEDFLVLPREGEFNHIVRVDARLDYKPDEAEGVLEEWGIEVDEAL